MSRLAIRLSGALLAGAATVSLVVGCSSGTDGHRVTDLALTQSELPAGFTVARLGKDQLQQVTDQLHDSTKSLEVKPAGCQAPGTMTDKVDTAETGVMAATNSTFSISQTVQSVAAVDGGVDLAAARDRVSGQCASVHVEVTAGPIKGAEIDVRNTVLDVLGVDGADQLLVVESTDRTVNGARTGTTTLLVGRAVVNDVLITVEMTPIDDGGTAPDRDLFTRILQRAVDKAAA